MSCDCCCKNTLNLCDVSVCDEIDFGISAQVDGEHKMIVDFLGTQRTITKEFSIDDKIVFTVSGLNENYTYSARLYEPDGKQIIISKDDINYDCFKFKTVLNVSITA